LAEFDPCQKFRKSSYRNLLSSRLYTARVIKRP
jgi:hypothetical protein